MEDAREMLEELKGFAMLRGARGQAACNIEELCRVICAVSHLMSSCDDIEELDLNPVRAYPDGAMALDARIILSK